MNPLNHTSRNIALVTSIFGGIVLLGVGGTAAIAAVGNATVSKQQAGARTVDMQGITSVDIESSAAQFTLEFGDVSEATLLVEGDRSSRWEMGARAGELSVTSEKRFFCLGWCGPGDTQVTLTLPWSFDDGSLEADFEVNAGSLTAAGAFREVSLEVNAGAIVFDGEATSIDATVNAGRAELDALGARSADLEVSAGRMVANLTGGQPNDVALEVSAGQLELTVPRGTYDVRSDVSAGSLDNMLETSSKASNRIDATVSAGSATLRAGA